ncbi:hypothetical protein V865_002290 [Kwoniella europaea PYCC6329]|uniref:Kri1-like C-terminal domain-containing protein n=1 Tax=Kwoniella europaea PYCC6329 TaxID=1423913 RepID=A0AAX4KEU8_9TREE
MQASSSKLKPTQDPLSGSESESESDYSSSDVTEDEDGDELTPALDAAILRTLSKIKRKEGVYGKEDVLQEELKKAQERAEAKGIKAPVVKKVVEKPYLLQDYHRAKLLSGSNQEDDEDGENEQPLTYVQSKRKLKEEAVSAFKALASDDSDDDGEEFIKKREKDEGEEDMEDGEYRQFLLEMGGGEDEVRKILGMGDQPISTALDETVENEKGEKDVVLAKVEKEEIAAKKQAKKEKKAKKDDEFLMNYILNRGWIDRSENHVPTYKEVVGDDEESDEGVEEKPKAGPSSHPWGELDEEDEFDDKADAFEAEYNFRFEEPGASNILSHPRQIDTLVRRPDDARKTKRARRAERKAAEKAAQEEALKAKKGSKRREMEKRMAALKSDLAAEGVDGEVDWDSLQKVLDGEWDENEWEKVVGRMLSKAGEKEDEDGKPVWDDDIGDAEYDDLDEDGGYPYNQDGEEEAMDIDGEYGEEDEGPINMDADFIDEEPSKKKRKKDKKKNKQKERDVEEPSIEDQSSLTLKDKAQAVKEVMEEYKALDHEDIIGGDLPTKFKYTKSAPVSFGLTPVEILLATDEELNKVLSVKTIAPYRKGGIGHQGKGLGQRVRQLKEDLRKRKWGQDDNERKPWKENRAEHAAKKDSKSGVEGGGGEEKRSKKRKGKKERKRAAVGGEEGGEAQV